jgi:hypothetical protein
MGYVYLRGPCVFFEGKMKTSERPNRCYDTSRFGHPQIRDKKTLAVGEKFAD